MVLIIGFIVLIAVNIIGLSVTSRRSTTFGIERIAISAIAPFQELVTRSLRFARDIWRQYFYLVTVAKENHVLTHQLGKAVENQNQWHETELANVRHVAIPQSQLDTITNSTPAYSQIMVKKGTFKGLDRDINTIRLGIGWMVLRDSDPQVAYVVAKTMIAHYKEMSKKARHYASIEPIYAAARRVGISALEVGAPLHPGAIRFILRLTANGETSRTTSSRHVAVGRTKAAR